MSGHVLKKGECPICDTDEMTSTIARIRAEKEALVAAAGGLLALIGHGEGGPFKPDPTGTYNERVEALFVAIEEATRG